MEVIDSNYECKIPTLEQINKRWDYEISIHNDNDQSNWIIWKEKLIQDVLSNRSITYYGFLNNEIIVEATASISPESYFVKNSKDLIDDKTAYLSAFRTNKEYRNQGFFSKLFNFMIDNLIKRGYTQFTLGVEKDDYLNKSIYLKFGFTKYIKTQIMEYPNGEKIEVEYYMKQITE